MNRSNLIVGAVLSLAGLGVMASGASAYGSKDYGAPGVAVAQSTVMFSGADWAKDSSYFYSGTIFALNRDLSKDGFLLRAFGGYGDYEYDAGSDRIDGDAVQADVMIGYKWGFGRFDVMAYIGVDYQDFDLSPPDPGNRVQGSETGFKVAADILSAYNSPIYWALSGSYSTAFDTYWARGRIGYNAGRFVIGPEYGVMGNEGYDGQRVGGFVTINFKPAPGVYSEISGYVGHQSIDADSSGGGASRGGDGTYGGVSFSLAF